MRDPSIIYRSAITHNIRLHSFYPLSPAGLHHRLPGWRRGLRAREDRPLDGQVRAQPLQQAQEDLHVQGGAEAARRDQGVKLLHIRVHNLSSLNVNVNKIRFRFC